LEQEGSIMLEQAMEKLWIKAEYGKDGQAERLIRKLVLSYFLLSSRDLWIYLYDWIIEVYDYLRLGKEEEKEKLMNGRKLSR